MANTELSSLLLFITKTRKISYTVEENTSLQKLKVGLLNPRKHDFQN